MCGQLILRGIAGIQGPFYGGTGCFHRRKIIYGQPPDNKGTQGKELNPYTSRSFNLKAFPSVFMLSCFFPPKVFIAHYVKLA